MPRLLPSLLFLALFGAAACSPHNADNPGTPDAGSTDVPVVTADQPGVDAPAVDLGAAVDVPTARDAPVGVDTPAAMDVPAATDVPRADDVGTATDVLAVPDGFGMVCHSDRECSVAGLVCDVAQNHCVECVRPVDCPADHVCQSGHCAAITHCTTSRMCPGQVCNTTLGYCTDCVADVDCGSGAYCRPDSTCASQTCAPATTRCVDPSHASVCDARGTSEAASACPSGQSCRTDRCTPWVCTPGQLACLDVHTRQVCTADGGGFMSTACAADASCAAGTCQTRTCAPGAASCADGTTRAVCNADGLGATNTACPSAANAGPACASGVCGITCVVGFGDCNGSAADGCESRTATDAANCGACNHACPTGQVCAAGLCTTCPPAATAPQVLFYGTLGSIESPFLPTGSVVTVATDAMWRAYTTADFARYNLIVIGDPATRGSPTFANYQAAYDTRDVWGAAVRGRIVVTGLDPGFHATDSTLGTTPDAGAITLLRAALAWTATGAGTGLYVSSDYGARSLSFLSPFGTFSSTMVSAVDAVTAVGTTHPVLVGSTSATLSNWTVSAHSFLGTYPSGFTLLATVPTSSAVLVARSSQVCER